MSLAKIGKKLSDEHRARIGRAHKGMKRSPETCASISAAKRRISDETRAKMSAAARRRCK